MADAPIIRRHGRNRNRSKRGENLDVTGDNILDIAEFTVEKYEFRKDTTLAATTTRERAVHRDRGRAVASD